MKKYKYDRVFTYKGKRHHLRADTLEDLGRKKAEIIRAIDTGAERESNITVSEWAYKCIETYKTNQSAITRTKYIQRVKYCILNHIGSMRVKDITPLHCQQLLNQQAGKSKTQINEVYNALKFIFSYAVFNGLILKDPTIGLQKPKGTRNARRALTAEERAALLAVASKERKYYCFLLMLCCGCRPGEACECKRSDVYLNSDGSPMLHIPGTKTENASRDVPMPTELYKLIKGLPKSAYISVLPNGNKINIDYRGKLWHGLWYKMNIEAGTETFRNQLLEPYRIPKDLTPYCLRHEFCSELARRGVDIRIAQKLMGHSDISLTANIYTHVDTRDLDAVAKQLQGWERGWEPKDRL